jgi:hypothetical protein
MVWLLDFDAGPPPRIARLREIGRADAIGRLDRRMLGLRWTTQDLVERGELREELIVRGAIGIHGVLH